MAVVQPDAGRTLNQKMAPALGQNFVIDNRAGAGGAIGTGVVAKSAPDGYTLLNTSSSHASLPVVSPSLSYDPVVKRAFAERGYVTVGPTRHAA